jgi:hypothetical protein
MKAKIYLDNGKLLEEVECDDCNAMGNYGLTILSGPRQGLDSSRPPLRYTNLSIIIEDRKSANSNSYSGEVFDVTLFGTSKLIKKWLNCTDLVFLANNAYSFHHNRKSIDVYGKVYMKIK